MEQTLDNYGAALGDKDCACMSCRHAVAPN